MPYRPLGTPYAFRTYSHAQTFANLIANLITSSVLLLAAINAQDVSGFPRNLLQHLLKQGTDPQVQLDFRRAEQDGKTLEFTVAIEREGCCLTASASKASRWAQNAAEALCDAWSQQQNNNNEILDIRQQLSKVEGEREEAHSALAATRMLLLAAREQAADHRAEGEWNLAQHASALSALTDAAPQLSEMSRRVAQEENQRLEAETSYAIALSRMAGKQRDVMRLLSAVQTEKQAKAEALALLEAMSAELDRLRQQLAESQCARQALEGEVCVLKALGAQDGCNNGMAQAELALTPPGHDGERCRPQALELSKNAEVAACEHAELLAKACAHKQAMAGEARQRMLEAEASLARSQHALEVCSRDAFRHMNVGMMQCTM